MVLLLVATLITVSLALLYMLILKKFDYWKDQNIPFVKPSIPYGNFKGLGSKYFNGELTQRIYNELKSTNEQFVGMFGFHRPIVLAMKIDFVKNVLIKDFNNFVNRGVYFNEKDDPLSAHLFSIEGKKWRNLRTKLSPTFTSGKMKFMYPTIIKVSENFKTAINKMLDKSNGSEDVEIKDLLARFTTDVIGECAFGIECNSLNNPDAEFREMGRKIFTPQPNMRWKRLLIQFSKDLARFLGLKFTRKEIENFFMGIVRETVDLREKSGVKRNDFMDLLVKLKSETRVDEATGEVLKPLTINEVGAQAFIFFIAGFETSSTTMMFALYELAANKTIQERARKEIKEVLAKHNGQFTYEAMLDMPYIDQIINESLRKYPPVANLMRVAMNDYKVPNTKHTIYKGTPIWIPAYAIQRDPEYYPNPELYDPDRFTAEEMQKRDNITFLPFGDGPRNCIGLRFGLMQARVGLVTLLSNYEISYCDKSTVPLVIDTKSFILSPVGGVMLNIKRITE